MTQSPEKDATSIANDPPRPPSGILNPEDMIQKIAQEFGIAFQQEVWPHLSISAGEDDQEEYGQQKQQSSCNDANHGSDTDKQLLLLLQQRSRDDTTGNIYTQEQQQEQERQWSFDSAVGSGDSTLKRKRAEDERSRKRESWSSLLSPSSSSSPSSPSSSPSSPSSSAASGGIVLTSISIPPLRESGQPRVNESAIANDQDWAIEDDSASDEVGEVDGDEDASGEENEEETVYRTGARNKRRQPQARMSPGVNQGSKLAASTLKKYRTRQNHWKKWCIRKRYTDGDRVTREKYLLYANELTAEVEHRDDDNPHLSVIPLAASTDQFGRSHPACLQTVNGYMAAVRMLCEQQCLQDYPDLKPSDILPKGIAHDIVSAYKERFKKSSQMVGTGDGKQGRQSQNDNNDNNNDINGGDDSADNNSKSDNDDNNSTDEDDHWVAEVSSTLFKRTMQELWKSNATYLSQGSWKTAAQNRFRLAFDRFKSDDQHDVSTFKLSNLHLLHIASPINKDVFTTGIAVTTTYARKVAEQARYSIFFREKDVHICPVGALAFYLLARWSDKNALPDFDDETWESAHLIPSKDEAKSAAQACYTSLKLRMTNDEFETGASADSYDSNIEEALNDGGELDKFTLMSLSDPPTGRGLYMITATLSKDSVFRLPRNKVLPPANLQRQLFPFIENMFPRNPDWTTWIDNIMMNRPEDANRAKNRKRLYPRTRYPIVRLMILLVRLRRVILQDFAAMVVVDDIDGRGGRRHTSFVKEIVVQYPFMSSPAFLEYAAYLQKTMEPQSLRPPRTPVVRNTSADEEVRRLVVQQNRSASNMHNSTADDDKLLADPVDARSNQPRHKTRRRQHSQRPSTTRTADNQLLTNIPMQKNNGASDFLQQDIQVFHDKVASLEKDVLQLSSDQNYRGRNQHLSFAQSSSGTGPSSTHPSTVVQEDDPALLWQEIHRLREQLAVKDQEKNEALEAATMAIEAATLAVEAEKSMENRVTEMERSMQGLWAMVAKAEAERYAMGPRIKVAMDQQRRQDKHELLKEQFASFRKKFVANGKAVSRS